MADKFFGSLFDAPTSDVSLPKDLSLPDVPEKKLDTEAASPATKKAAQPGRWLPPEDMKPIFEAAAREFNVPVNVLMALGHQESRYNANAIGQPTQWGRAKGVMQYLDDTAKGLGINPFDPAQAIPAAAKQLSERLRKGYSMEDAVKEHFAGPDRRQWGEKTAAYGREVMEKVGKIGELIDGGSSGVGNADLQKRLDAEEPGRYRVMSEDQAMSMFSPNTMSREAYQGTFLKLNPNASQAAIDNAMGDYDKARAAKMEIATSRVQNRFDTLQSPEAMFEQRLNRRLQGPANGIVPQLPEYEKEKPEEKDDTGDFMRRFYDSGRQAKALAEGTLGLFGDISERNLGIGKDLKDWGYRKYREDMAITEKRAKPYDDALYVYERAKKGDFGPVVDYLQGGAGYLTGQALEAVVATVGGAVIGTAAGTTVPGVGNAAGAVGGGIAGAASKTAVKKILGNAIEKRLAAYAAEAAAKGMAEAEARQYAKQVLGAKVLGSLAGSQAFNLSQELGTTYGGARDEKKGGDLTGKEVAKATAAGTAAAAIETLGDAFGFSRFLKSSPTPLHGIAAYIGAIAKEAGINMTSEGIQELAQTALERYGSGKDLTNQDAARDYINSVLLGSLGGAARGTIAGAINNRKIVTGSGNEQVDQIQIKGDQQENSTTVVAVPAEKSTAAGPLTRAIENAADQHANSDVPPRVTVVAPEGTITGFAQDLQEDDHGGFMARVLGDDGQVYQFTDNGGVQINVEQKTQAGPLTSAVEKSAEEHAQQKQAALETKPEIPVVAEKQKVADVSLTNEGETKAAEPAAVEAQKFNANGLQPGTPEYEAAFSKWSEGQQEANVKDSNRRQRDENKKAAEIKNGWRKKVLDWFIGAQDGDTITTNIEGEEYRVIEKEITRGGKKIKQKILVAVGAHGKGRDINIAEMRDGELYGVLRTDIGIDEDTGSIMPESDTEQRASTLGMMLESGEAKGNKKKQEVHKSEPIDLTGRTDQQLQYLSEKGQPGFKEAAVAELAKRKQAAPELRLEDMDEPQLRARMKYIVGKAKANGGWNKLLTTARKEVEREINRRKEATSDQGTDTAAVRVRDERAPGAEVPAQTQGDQQGAGAAGSATGGEQRSVSGKPESGDGTAVSGAGTAADAKPALNDIGSGRWFSTKEKADAFIAKKKAGATHEVVQTGKVRFEVKPKSNQVVEANKMVEDESAPGIEEWRAEFSAAKKAGNKKAVQSLYDKVLVALNGVAQARGDDVVAEFNKLKKEIEDYAESVRKAEAAPASAQQQTEGADNGMQEGRRQEEVAATEAQAEAKPEPAAEQKEAKKPAKPRKTAAKKDGEAASTEDSGEELKFNKRNRKAALTWDDLKGQDAALRVSSTTKAKVLEKPDYQALIDGGMDTTAAYVVKQVYDSISAKPQTRLAPTDEQLQQYIAGANRVMAGVVAWANGEGGKAWVARMGSSTSGQQGEKLLDAVYPEGWRSQHDELRLIGGNKVLAALQPGLDDARKAGKEIDKGWPAKMEAWQKQGYKIAQVDQPQLITTNYYDGKRRDGTPYVSVLMTYSKNRQQFLLYGAVIEAESKNDEAVTQAVDAVTEDAKAGKHFLIDKAGNAIGSYDTLEAAQEAARDKAKRDTGGNVIDERGISVEMARRTGKDRRMEGEDVTSERLMEEFGFRGVNFGNWLKGKSNSAERQLHLNHAYDSFMDLADVLGVPPKAMSLNGMLGIAIGAQGNGKAAAHFVPGLNEINITRTAGAGALAHEWGHALDHYFARLAGLDRESEPFLTEHATMPSEITRSVPDPENPRKLKTEKSPRFAAELRPEILDKFKDIVTAMNKRELTPGEIETRRNDSIAKAKKQLDGWLASIKRDFRSPSMVQAGKAVPEADFDAVAERIRKLDLGDGTVALGKTAFVSPVVDELRGLYKKATGSTYSIDNIKSLQQWVDYLKHVSEEKADAKTHVPQTTTTTFAAEAVKLDKDKGGKKYWSTDIEKFARAFDAYVSDKLAEKAMKNTYLAGLNNDPMTSPMGEERKAINKAFDGLVETIETSEEGGKIVLSDTRLEGEEDAADNRGGDGRRVQGGNDAGDAVQQADARRREAFESLREFAGIAIATRIENQGASALVGASAGSPKDLAAAAQIYRNPRFETSRVVFVRGGRVVFEAGVTSRLPGYVAAVPATMGEREFYRWIGDQKDRLNADGYYLMHNHPSGDPTPSGDDVAATVKMAGEVAGFLGHVIINSNKYAVIDANGNGEVRTEYFGEDNLLKASKPHELLNRQLASMEDLAVLGKSLQQDGYVTLIGIASKKIRAITSFPLEQYKTAKDAKIATRYVARKSGSSQVFVVGDVAGIQHHQELIENGFIAAAIDADGKLIYGRVRQGMQFGINANDVAKMSTRGEAANADAAAATIEAEEGPKFSVAAGATEAGFDGVKYTEGYADAFIAFRPSQVKSATGNSGAFDPTNPDIRYSVTPEQDQVTDDQLKNLTPDEQGLLRRVQSALQDNMNRLKEVQDRIKKLTGLNELGSFDYYRAEANRPGRIAARLEDGKNQFFEPLMKELAEAKKTPEQLEELLHAMHAKERNERIAKINDDMPDGGSGMMTADAEKILDKYRDDKELHDIADKARLIAKETLALKHAYGMIDDETLKALNEAYEFYVPLKGEGEFGPKIKRAMGHESRDERILDNIARDYNQAIVVGEKNLARQSLLKMVLKFNDDALWTARVPPKGRYIAGRTFYIMQGGKKVAAFDSLAQATAYVEGAKGLAEIVDAGGEKVAEYTKPLQDNEVMVYVKGQPVRIQIKDAKLATQLRPLDQARMNPILEAMRGLNQYLAKIYTGYNPAFMLRNMVRDSITGTINILGREGAKTAAQAWKNYPKAISAIGQWAATKQTPNTETGKYLNQYRMYGGKVGASWMSDLEQQGKTLQRMYEDAYGASGYLADGKKGKAALVAGRKIIGGMAHAVEIGNQATENALRLALFIALREQGVSAPKAAQAAKTVTVDFDRKGTATPALGAIYLFINPSIQGTANAMNTLVNGEHKAEAWTALAALAALGMYAAFSGMDDDKDRWLGQSWDSRTKNFILNVGGHEVRVPISYEFAPYYAFGIGIGEALRGEKPIRSAHNIVSSFIDAYFPLPNAYNPDSDNKLMDAAMSAVPTAVKPAVEIGANRNTFGSQIVPESEFTKDNPDTTKMYRATKGSVYDAAAQVIAAPAVMAGISGQYENDLTKVSPETVKYLWRTYTGGLGQFITDTIGAGWMAATDPEAVTSSDVPFVKDFYKANDVKPIRSRYYNLAREARAAAAEFKQAEKVGDDKSINKILADDEKMNLISVSRSLTKLSREISELRDIETEINADKNLSVSEKRKLLKENEAQQEELYRAGISMFRKAGS